MADAKLDIGAPGSGATDFSVELAADALFSGERLGAIADRVVRLREHWVERAPGFHTLGYALYRDGSDLADGELPVEESNARLDDNFGAELAELRAFLSRELGGDVEWARGLPLPGFHVFDAEALTPGMPTGNSHFDIQYVWGRFDEPVLDAVSVTVPIRIPAAGTSLEYWPVDYAKFERLYASGELDTLADAERRFERREVPYDPGRPCLIRGLPLHRIGPTPRVEPSDHRITLQGHAVRLGERWIAYW